MMKYGHRDYRGGGRSSARETLARVAAGAIAKKFLKSFLNIEILSYVEQVGSIRAEINAQLVGLSAIEETLIRCPHPIISEHMIKYIEEINKLKTLLVASLKALFEMPPPD